jgi:hypothetical protein
MLIKDEIKMWFESSAVFKHVECDVAYGRLYLNDMSTPALRVCMDAYTADLPLRIDGGRLRIVEKAPYYIQIPPYLYITYTTAPDILYLISTWEAKRVFCYADASTCTKLPPIVYGPPHIEHVYTVLRGALV